MHTHIHMHTHIYICIHTYSYTPKNIHLYNSIHRFLRFLSCRYQLALQLPRIGAFVEGLGLVGAPLRRAPPAPGGAGLRRRPGPGTQPVLPTRGAGRSTGDPLGIWPWQRVNNGKKWWVFFEDLGKSPEILYNLHNLYNLWLVVSSRLGILCWKLNEPKRVKICECLGLFAYCGCIVQQHYYFWILQNSIPAWNWLKSASPLLMIRPDLEHVKPQIDGVV